MVNWSFVQMNGRNTKVTLISLAEGGDLFHTLSFTCGVHSCYCHKFNPVVKSCKSPFPANWHSRWSLVNLCSNQLPLNPCLYPFQLLLKISLLNIWALTRLAWYFGKIDHIPCSTWSCTWLYYELKTGSNWVSILSPILEPQTEDVLFSEWNRVQGWYFFYHIWVQLEDEILYYDTLKREVPNTAQKSLRFSKVSFSKVI